MLWGAARAFQVSAHWGGVDGGAGGSARGRLACVPGHEVPTSPRGPGCAVRRARPRVSPPPETAAARLESAGAVAGNAEGPPQKV